VSASAKVRTCLWFDTEGEDVARFYVSLLSDSRIDNVYRPDPDGPPLVIEFTLAGAPYMVLNGGPHSTHSPAASISVLTANQAETDALWSALVADGGQESQCGWVVDRFGVSWQVVPEIVPRMMSSGDAAAAKRAHAAMMGMKKLDIAALEAAYSGA
jgi:predicted 3-demethylubiquinone-9 3-methyltransferase (glyoxalase superfamily)